MTQIRCQEGQEVFFNLKPDTKPKSIADQPKKGRCVKMLQDRVLRAKHCNYFQICNKIRF